MQTTQKSVSLVASLSILSLALFWPRPSHALTRPITFPVIGAVSYSDDFGAARSGGRSHEGNDLMGHKGQSLVAAVDGMVHLVAYPEPDYGYAIFLEDAEGYQYWYLHINNDHPGTDDGLGGGMNAYAPDMVRSYPVVKGQLIGWMGDSGNAEATSAHLHFEIHMPNGQAVTPFSSLRNARHIGQPVNPPALPNELLPYGVFRGGAAIVAGEFDGRSDTSEFATVAGPGGGPQVRIFNESNRPLSQFFASSPTDQSGLDIAAADIDGDGIDEIITGAGPGGTPEVKIFTKDGAFIRSFLAYQATLRSGVNVAAADLDGDHKAEIMTGPRAGAGPQVKIFSPLGGLVGQFFAYAQTFRGGIDIAAAPLTATLPGRIVTGAGPGGGPHVRVFDRFGNLTTQFFPYDEHFRGGIRVSIGDFVPSLDGWEILTAPASRGGPDFRMYSHDGLYRGRLTAFEEWWRGGYDVAVGQGVAYVVSGHDPRRTSVRPLSWNFGGSPPRRFFH